MKKPKGEKPGPPISLSAKKSGALKHDMLFTPYKIEWKNVQLEPTSHHNSRTFFNTMKSELSSLKNDVQKLIKRDSSKSQFKVLKTLSVDENMSTKKTQCQAQNGEITKASQNVYLYEKYAEKRMSNPNPSFPKNAESHKSMKTQKNSKQLQQKQQQVESLQKQNKLQKNLINQMNRENDQLYQKVQKMDELEVQLKKKQCELIKLANEKQKLVTELEQRHDQILDKDGQINLLTLQNSKLEQHFCIIKQSLDEVCKQKTELSKENEDIKAHNAFLQQQIQSLNQKMLLFSAQFNEKQVLLKQLENKLQKAAAAVERQNQVRKEFEQNCSIKQKQLRQGYEQKIGKILQENLESYQILKTEKQKLQTQLENKDQQLERACQKTSKTAQQITSVDFRQLGSQFQRKINTLIEQNYSLKNKLSNLESELQKMQVDNEALRQEIKIHQQRRQDELQQNQLQKELQKVLMELRQARIEKDELIEQYEIKIMRLENHAQERGIPANPTAALLENKDFNTILKDQLSENEQLKSRHEKTSTKLRQLQKSNTQLTQRLAILSQQLQICKLKLNTYDSAPSNQSQQAVQFQQSLARLGSRVGQLSQTLDLSQKQLRAKDDFIERVLVSKIGRQEEQEDIAFIMRELGLQRK